MEKGNIWLNNPEYVQFVEFLVLKTKEVKQILSVTELAREFKRKISSPLKVHCFECRISSFRLVISKMPHLDTETKVKLMFGLSGSVNHGFLRELRREAEVTVDDFNRIIHYKKNGEGGLELKGKHISRKSEVSNNQILEFLAKKVDRTSGIIKISELVKQFKAETGSSQNACHLGKRIRVATKQIYECESFDEEMKVRMMFATSTEVEEYALKELREYANIVVDEDNRIIKYEKKDGSLNLNKEEDHCRNVINYSDDVEDSEEGVEEDGAMEVTTRSGRISKKRFSDACLFNNTDDMFAPQKWKLKSSNNPTTSNKKRKISNHTVGTDKRKKPVVEMPSEDRQDNDFSFDISYQKNDNTGVKLEPFNGVLNDDTSRRNIINNGDDFVEEIPAPTQNFVAPKYEEFWMDIKMEEPDYSDSNFSNNQYKKDHTNLITILEAFHDLIDTLDISILSDLQKKIEAKLEECRGDSILKTVSNEEIYYSLKLCLLKVNKNWDIKESLELFSLESFLSSFEHAVAHMKCPSLIEFQEKLLRIIEELRVQNKFVPVTTIRNALQSVIDNIIIS